MADLPYYRNEGDRQAAEAFAKDRGTHRCGVALTPDPLRVGVLATVAHRDEPAYLADEGVAFARERDAERLAEL